jgi:hypothetical protein
VIVVSCFFKRFIKLTGKKRDKIELTKRTSQLMSVPLINAYLDIRACGIANVPDNSYTTVYTLFSW